MVKNFKSAICLLLSVLVLSSVASNIEKRIDEFSGDTVYSTFNKKIAGTELYITKTYQSEKYGNRYFYILHLSTNDYSTSYRGSGITILFEDGSKLK